MDGDALTAHIETARDAKATKVVQWLTTVTVCRACGLEIRRNGYGDWIDREHHAHPATRGKVCLAPGFAQRNLRIPHRPEQWTPALLAGLSVEERDVIPVAAGVKRPCSETTWERVVVLFEARTGL